MDHEEMNKLAEYLRTAGCSEQDIRALTQEDAQQRRQSLLRCRCHVQERISRVENEISCLDYLIYKLQRKSEERMR